MKTKSCCGKLCLRVASNKSLNDTDYINGITFKNYLSTYVLSISMSLNLLNRASPLAFNVANSSIGANCSDTFANGADIQISNIDYRLSRKELQQLMQEAFSRHGKVAFSLLFLPLFHLLLAFQIERT